MSVYVVTYDLNKTGQDYSGLIARLESYPTKWHLQKSGWIVVTSQTAVQVRDYLLPCIDANDSLLVGELGANTAWYVPAHSDWLKQQFVKKAA